MKKVFIILLALCLVQGRSVAQSDSLKVCGLTREFVQSLADPATHAQLRAKWGAAPTPAVINCGRFRITFDDETVNDNYGFDDPVTGVFYRQCACDVANYIQTVFDIPAGDGTPIDILFNQSWLAGTNPVPVGIPPSTLAIGGPLYNLGAAPGFYGGNVFQHMTTGNDPDPLNIDGQITVNFNYPYRACNEIRDCGKFDLYSILLHEFTHALGWVSSLQESATFFPESSWGGNRYSRYDQFFLHFGNIQTGPLTHIVDATNPAAPFIDPSIPANALTSRFVWYTNVIEDDPANNQNCPTWGVEASVTGSNPPNTISHFGVYQDAFDHSAHFAPGFVPEYVMGPVFVQDWERNTYTVQELRFLNTMGYAFNPAFLASMSINPPNPNGAVIANRHPYTTKLIFDENWYGPGGIYNDGEQDDNAFTPAEFTITNCQNAVFDLSTDARLADPDGDPIRVFPGSLYNIRGCGIGGNNSNALNVVSTPAGDVITYTPRPNFIGRAQFGFCLYDGSERGQFMIYTIDVTGCNPCLGNNMVVNGDFEEGGQVKTLTDPTPENSMFFEVQDIKYIGDNDAIMPDGMIYSNSDFSIIRESVGCDPNVGNFGFAFRSFSPGTAPVSVAGTGGDRYLQVVEANSYFRLCTPAVNCTRYIAEFDYFDNNPENLTFGFTDNPLNQGTPAPLLSSSAPIALPATGGVWQHVAIPINYCSATASGFFVIENPPFSFSLYIDNLDVHVDPAPPVFGVAITPASPTICAGGNVTLTANIANPLCAPVYSWAPVVSAASAVNVSPAANTTYTVSVNDGCSVATATATVTVGAGPVATFSYTGSPYCTSGTDPFPTFSGGGVAGVFSSTAGLVFVSTATGQVDLSASTPGTYTVTNTIPPSGGCAGTNANATITINAPPVATFFYAGSPYCPGTATALPTFTGGGVGGTFSSTAGLVFVSTATGQVNLTASTPGTYTVTNIVPASGGCPAALATATITIANMVVSASSSAASVCPGESVTLSVTGAPSGSTITWSPGGMTGATVTAAISTATTYTVNVVFAGCTASSTVSVGVNTNCCTAPPGNTVIPSSGGTSTSYPAFVGSPVAINGNYTVLSGATVIMSSINDVRIAAGVKIIVNNGGTLIIDKCNLYTCSTTMWEGIEVLAGGMLKVQNGTRIEDAKAAVLSNNSGGVANFLLESSKFNRNYVGVKVINYFSSTLHPGIIRDCLFDSQTWPTTGGIITLDAPYSTQTAEYGVELSSVGNIKIGDQSLAIYQNRFRYLRTGIRSQGSTYLAVNNDFRNNVALTCIGTHGGPPCPVVGWAIWNTGSKATIGGYVPNEPNIFKNLANGIFHEKGFYLDVFNNSFDNITNTPSSISIAIYTTGFSQGSPSAITIKDNTFKDLERGMYHANNFATSYFVMTNTIKNFTDHGVYCLQNSAGGALGGIVIQANNFNEAAATSTYTGNIGIEVANAITYNNPGVTIRNNYEYKINKGIVTTGILKPQILQNVIGFKNSVSPPGFYYGIRTQYCKLENIYQNNVYKATNPTSSFEFSLYGISVESSASMAGILENTTQRMGQGVRCFNDATGDLAVRCNIMTNNWIGLGLDNANIGPQGASAVASPPDGEAQDNNWNLASSMIGSRAAKGYGGYTPNDFYTRSGLFVVGAYPWCPSASDITPPFPSNPVKCPSTNGSTYLVPSAPHSCSNICYTLPIPCPHFKLAKIARNEVPFSSVTGMDRYNMQEAVVKTILTDSIPPDTTTADGHDLQSYVDTTIANSEVGKLVTVSKMYSDGDTLGARNLNASISPKNCADNARKTVNAIFFNTWAVGNFDLSPSDISTLNNIAIQSPVNCGTAVYDARVMLGLDLNDYTGDGRMMETAASELGAIADKIGVLYPNPASNSCTYEAQLEETQTGFIMMYDITGRLLQSYKFNSGDNKVEMNLSEFDNGIYLYKIIVNGEIVDNKKLVIQK